MCLEKFSVRLEKADLEKILVDLKAGKYPLNQEDPTYKIARETLNEVYKGKDEAASFGTACRFEEMLIKAHIGKVWKGKTYQVGRSRRHREIAA